MAIMFQRRCYAWCDRGSKSPDEWYTEVYASHLQEQAFPGVLVAPVKGSRGNDQSPSQLVRIDPQPTRRHLRLGVVFFSNAKE